MPPRRRVAPNAASSTERSAGSGTSRQGAAGRGVRPNSSTDRSTSAPRSATASQGATQGPTTEHGTTGGTLTAQGDAPIPVAQGIVPMVSNRTMPDSPVMWGRELSWTELEILGRFFYSNYFAAHDRWDSVPLEEQRQLQAAAYLEVSAYLLGLPEHPLHRWIPWLLAGEGCRPGRGPGMVPVMNPDECVARWEWTVPGARALARHTLRRGEVGDYVCGEDPFPSSDSDDWEDFRARPRQATRRTAAAFNRTSPQGQAPRQSSQGQPTNRRELDALSATISPTTPAPATGGVAPTPPMLGVPGVAPSPRLGSTDSVHLTVPSGQEVPADIKGLCTEAERNFYNARFRSSTTEGDEVTWPAVTFASSYLRGGSSLLVREWALTRATRRIGSVDYPPIISPGGLSTARMPRSNRPIWSSKYQNPVTQPNDGEFTLQEACPHVNPDDAHRRIKNVQMYDPQSETLSLRDYCAWFDHYRIFFSGLPRELANYVLLSSVQGRFSYEVLNDLREEIAFTPTAFLALDIGRVVYRYLKIDPTQVANTIRLNSDGCPTQYHVYRRVADLHLCRSDSCTASYFCRALFYAFVSHANIESKAKGDQLLRAYESTYPLLNAESDPSLPLTAMDHLSDRPLPETHEDIRVFVLWLLDQVMLPVAADLAGQFKRYAVIRTEKDNVSPTANHNRNNRNNRNPRFKRERDPRDDLSHDSRRGAQRRISTPEPHRAGGGVKATPKLPNVPPSTPTRSTRLTTTDRSVICPHCSKPGHTEDRCWEKHPELKRERRSRTASEVITDHPMNGEGELAPPFRVGEGNEIMFDNAAPRGRGRSYNNRGSRGRGPRGRGRVQAAPVSRVRLDASSSSSSTTAQPPVVSRVLTELTNAAPSLAAPLAKEEIKPHF